jgi:hypothetical protein
MSRYFRPNIYLEKKEIIEKLIANDNLRYKYKDVSDFINKAVEYKIEEHLNQLGITVEELLGK